MLGAFVTVLTWIAGVSGYVETKENDTYEQHIKNMLVLGVTASVLAVLVQLAIFMNLMAAVPSLLVIPLLFSNFYFLFVFFDAMVVYGIGAVVGKLVKVVEKGFS